MTSDTKYRKTRHLIFYAYV